MGKNKVVIWLHMHQPEYFDPISGLQYLPWVRRHLVKGYYTVANLIAKFPAKININFSGILLEQILRYTKENLTDYYDYLESKDASSLTESEANFVIEKFLVPVNGFRHKRFLELIEKKQHRAHFTTDEIRDVQFLFKLSAFSVLNGKASEMKEKERDFTEADKAELKEIEKEAMKSVLPLYGNLFRHGIVELTVSPFYHPILPLLINTDTAKESKRDTILPYAKFSRPEDAEWQIGKGIKIFQEVFGEKPKGMWPSEGSVSNETVSLIKQNGMNWIGTDEEILKRSTGGKGKNLVCESNGVKILFRNHALSDKIAFVYNKMNPKDAAEDFANTVKNSNRTEVVILDGENPWDYYEKGGVNFISQWLQSIEESSILGSEAEPKGKIESIVPGSWINGFFDTWVGHKESNKAWDYLANARNGLSGNESAMTEIYAAEGSDSFWWYSDFHKNEVDFSFDHLFRMHLIKAYENAGKIVPGYLFYPIKEAK